MKKTILCISFLFVGMLAVSAQKLEVTKASDNSINLGTAKLNTTLEKSVEIKNVGDKPLIITNVQGSCTCTVTDFTKTPIKPGKTGFIKVKQATSVLGKFTKSITIDSNDATNPKKQILISGEVTQ